MEQISKIPTLVASTIDTYCCSILESRIRESKLKDALVPEQTTRASTEEHLEVNYFKSAQW